ncbi:MULTISPECIES: hypothetical protein [Aequorivita]|uniref:Uncharacterized protein n=1 Tax=Aequorivita vladivostokensis TaxID=171194 RepID=A0ABR5DET2_9FLAO|nr:MULTISPECIES: hypothetical protein [Aequorivita]KJJ37287.1 hypothetical protein MB09_15270 [Aequorivita vladivostokensis]MDC7999617.1 hypothetical protein [Aequorivita todarodis]
MTIAEKRNKIKKAVESFSNEQLEETLHFIEKVIDNDERRKDYIKNLLIKEKNLFERLAK